MDHCELYDIHVYLLALLCIAESSRLRLVRLAFHRFYVCVGIVIDKHVVMSVLFVNVQKDVQDGKHLVEESS